MKTQKLLIERLESRDAPAVLFHFTDLDGDRVTVNISKGTSADLGPSFSFSDPNPLHPRYIREIDLAGGANPQVFAGANMTISVTRGPTGDGFSYVGWINAPGPGSHSVSRKSLAKAGCAWSCGNSQIWRVC